MREGDRYQENERGREINKEGDTWKEREGAKSEREGER